MKKEKQKYIIFLSMAAFLCLLFLFAHLWNIRKMETQKKEQYSAYITRTVKGLFTDLEGVESADVAVTHNQATGQYNLEVSLTTDREVNDEDILLYKNILAGYTDEKTVLIVNGEIQ